MTGAVPKDKGNKDQVVLTKCISTFQFDWFFSVNINGDKKQK